MGGKRFNLGVISALVALVAVSIVFIGGCTAQQVTVIEKQLVTVTETQPPVTVTTTTTTTAPPTTTTPTTAPPTPPTTPVTPGYIRVDDHKLGYGFEYPEDWESQLVEGEDVESVVMFTKPGTPTTLIVTVKLSNLTSLEEVKEEFREGLKGLGGTILEEREIVVNGREGYEVIYRPIAAVKMRQVIFIANGKSYMLVCSTAEVLYDEYEETFDHIIDSFAIE